MKTFVINYVRSQHGGETKGVYAHKCSMLIEAIAELKSSISEMKERLLEVVEIKEFES